MVLSDSVVIPSRSACFAKASTASKLCFVRAAKAIPAAVAM